MKDPKFLVDSMLGKIAKKLRIFGFNTEYFQDIDDDMLMKKSSEESRKILTKDKMLHKRCLKLNIPCTLITSENELENLIYVLKENDIDHLLSVTNNFTRCTICNGELLKNIKLESYSLTNKIPKKVQDTTNIFFKCSNCHKAYWDGTHMQQINKLITEINKKIRK